MDRRAWLLDRELPLWTYQLCLGMSRAGDPQAFGLSPLFALVLLFGSLWGSKLFVLACLAAGAYYTALILERFHAPAPDAGRDRLPYAVLAALFVLGNYFMWHLLVGHLTFAHTLLGLGIVHYTLKGYSEGLTRRELAAGVLLTWQHYSGGFLHSVAYLLLPFLLAFALFVAGHRLGAALRRRDFGTPLSVRLDGATTFHLLGGVLASYKLFAVWSYFQGVDRNLDFPHEVLSPLQIAGQLLIPTWNGRWLVQLDLGTVYDVHEYSAFTWLLPLLAVALLLRVADRGARASPPRAGQEPLALLAGCMLLVPLSFSLGEFGRFAPFASINHISQGETLRVIGRFNIGIALAAAAALMRVLRRPSSWRLVGPAGSLLLLGLLGLNLTSFLPLASSARLREILAFPSQPDPRMRGWILNPRPEREFGSELSRASDNRMYAMVLNGQGVADCYNALPMTKTPLLQAAPWMPLIDASIGDPDRPERACIEESYYTQNRVVLGPSCPALTCTGIGRVNPRQREPALFYSPAWDRWCSRRAPSSPRSPRDGLP